MAVEIYNTISRRTEPFAPQQEGEVSFYCCGPTVYDLIGVHNARTFVSFDLVRRYLEYRGYRVRYVQNITDIDDKIIARAAERGADPQEWAARYAEAYQEDMAALGVKEPDAQPRAMETLDEIVEMIRTLEEKNAAYATSSGVYFAVDSFERYGRLSGIDTEELRSGARVEVDEEKRDPRDFALWKRGKPGEPVWSSPWGEGRPGWHIECSAMARQRLGKTLDIHAAGADLIFPHHENEIAQSETANEAPLARYWMHGALMRIGGERMGKSLGNFIPVREALERYSAAQLRLFYASTHYRKPLDFTEEAIERQAAPLGRLNRCLDALEAAAEGAEPVADDEEELSGGSGAFLEALRQAEAQFTRAVDADFNFPGGLGVLFEFARTANRFLDAEGGGSDESRRAAASAAAWMDAAMSGLLGIRTADERKPDGAGRRLEAALSAALEWRARARQAGNWGAADALRDRLTELGVSVTDGKDGASWTLADGADGAEAADGAAAYLLGLRAEARARRDWETADALRELLQSAGVEVRDERA